MILLDEIITQTHCQHNHLTCIESPYTLSPTLVKARWCTKVLWHAHTLKQTP